MRKTFFTPLLLGVGLASSLNPSINKQESADQLLLRAAKLVRPFQGRLLGSSHGPFNLQDPRLASRERSQLLSKAESRLVDDRTSSDSADWSLARVSLLKGDWTRAIERLEKLRHGRRVGPLNDLAVAYMARARDEEQPRDLIRALTALEEISSEQRQLPEVLFNRLLVATLLFLPDEAGRRRQELLGKEADSKWLAEAESLYSRWSKNRVPAPPEFDEFQKAARGEHSEDLDELVSRAPDAAWRSLKDLRKKLIPETGPADSRSDESLGVGLQMAEALVRFNGDDYFRDVFAELKESVELEPALDRTRHALWESDLDAALAIIESTLARAKQSYAGLRAELLGLRGFARSVRGDLIGGLRDHLSSHELFRSSRYTAGAAEEGIDVAEILGLLGKEDAAWKWKHETLRTFNQNPSIELQKTYESIAHSLWTSGSPDVALLFQNEVIAQHEMLASRAKQASIPAAKDDRTRLVGRSTALFARARMAIAAGRIPAADKDLEKGRSLVKSISPDLPNRHLVVVKLVETEGRCHLAHGAAAKATESFTQALRITRKSGPRSDIPRLHLLRARSHLGQRDLKGAERDFQASLEELDALRRDGLFSREHFIAYSDQSREFFDQSVAFHLSRKDREKAFAVGELMRESTRRFQDTAPVRNSELAKLTSRLPDKVAILVYFVLDDKLALWLLQGGRSEHHEPAIPASLLDRKVETLLASLRSGDPIEDSAAALFDDLLGKIRTELKQDSHLVVVPDRMLHRVPFAVLFDRDRQKYLIERLQVSYAMSATSFLEEQSSSIEVTQPFKWPLIMGDPSLPRDIPQFPPLRYAREEAESLAAKLGGRAYVGTSATRKTFNELAPEADLIHIAAHGSVNRKDPDASFLALAPSSSDPGVLYARDIYQLALKSRPLVVLSACDTGSGAISSTYGALSLADPFLSKGARSVIASLWPVDDRFSKTFFDDFYDSLSTDKEPAKALRSAQLKALEATKAGQRSGWHWAAYIAVNGHSTNSNH